MKEVSLQNRLEECIKLFYGDNQEQYYSLQMEQVVLPEECHPINEARDLVRINLEKTVIDEKFRFVEKPTPG